MSTDKSAKGDVRPLINRPTTLQVTQET